MNVSKSSGHWYLYYRDDTGKRRGKSLGKVDTMTKRQAERAGERLFAKISRGEAEQRASSQTLAGWLNDYFRLKEGELAEHTHRVQQATRAKLIEFFGASTKLAGITPASADDFRAWLISRGLSTNTVGNHLRTCKAIWNRAVLRELVRANPFQGISSGVVASATSGYPWTDEEIERVLHACPSLDWQALVALCYYAGCRRSEALLVKWGDVLWADNKLIVTNKKTGKTNGPVRTVLMLPELERILLAQREVNGDRERVVVVRGDLFRTMQKITHAAGLGHVGSPIKSMRAARATAWKASGQYPEYVVDAWLGHSMAVSRKHYVSVPEDCYRRC